jgi:hypothetical protein
VEESVKMIEEGVMRGRKVGRRGLGALGFGFFGGLEEGKEGGSVIWGLRFG